MRVITTSLRADIALLSAGVIVAALPLFAGCAEEAGQEAEPPALTESVTRVEKAEPPGEKKAIDGWARRLQKKQAWWDHAREVLFADIELSAEQAQGVDAIIGEQLDKRAQLQQRDIELAAARKSRDSERIGAARRAFSEIRALLEEPHEIYEEMRALLSEEQRPQFDMNRAHHVAESQAPAKKRALQDEQRDRAESATW
jgi:hypothetical protein